MDSQHYLGRAVKPRLDVGVAGEAGEGSGAKVYEFNISLPGMGKKDIFRLQVAMDDALALQAD